MKTFAPDSYRDILSCCKNRLNLLIKETCVLEKCFVGSGETTPPLIRQFAVARVRHPFRGGKIVRIPLLWRDAQRAGWFFCQSCNNPKNKTIKTQLAPMGGKILLFFFFKKIKDLEGQRETYFINA
jgi:hypothetical protein